MPDIPPLDIMKEVGKIWQLQTENDLKKFRVQAKDDSLRYQDEMERFISMLNSLRKEQKHHAEIETGGCEPEALNIAQLNTQLTNDEKGVAGCNMFDVL